MYAESVPVLIRGLKALSAILEKAEAHCTDKKIQPEALLEFRLYPDMFTFTKQVQLVSDFAMRCGARLTGATVPSVPDTEKTFSELRARLAGAVSYLEALPRAAFDGAAQRDITMTFGGEERQMSGHDYLHGFLLPNFYFHLTTAYNILRHNGLALGKADFMGR